VAELAQPLVDELGLYVYELGLSYGRRPQLRVAVDRREKPSPTEGVTVSELTTLSRRLDRALELDGVLGADYALEVSSPGLERKLKTPEHMAGAIGELVEVVTGEEIEGKVTFEGKLVSVQGETLGIEQGDRRIEVPLAAVRKARTVYR
jgi:ribosome maturation factor RimP